MFILLSDTNGETNTNFPDRERKMVRLAITFHFHLGLVESVVASLNICFLFARADSKCRKVQKSQEIERRRNSVRNYLKVFGTSLTLI